MAQHFNTLHTLLSSTAITAGTTRSATSVTQQPVAFVWLPQPTTPDVTIYLTNTFCEPTTHRRLHHWWTLQASDRHWRSRLPWGF